MLRDWTDSDTMNAVSVYGERFFVRLIMKADDFGCFHADSRLLKSFLFPLSPDGVREADISRWIAECEKAGLIALYESAGKRYLQIQDFRQRLDKARNKFPLPTSGNPLPTVTDFPAELEVETERKRKEESAREDLSGSNLFRKPNIPTWDLVLESFTRFGGTSEMAKSFFDTHEATGWFLKGSPITNWASLIGKYISSWKKNDQNRGGALPSKNQQSVADQLRAARKTQPQ